MEHLTCAEVERVLFIGLIFVSFVVGGVAWLASGRIRDGIELFCWTILISILVVNCLLPFMI